MKTSVVCGPESTLLRPALLSGNAHSVRLSYCIVVVSLPILLQPLQIVLVIRITAENQLALIAQAEGCDGAKAESGISRTLLPCHGDTAFRNLHDSVFINVREIGRAHV